MKKEALTLHVSDLFNSAWCLLILSFKSQNGSRSPAAGTDVTRAADCFKESQSCRINFSSELHNEKTCINSWLRGELVQHRSACWAVQCVFNQVMFFSETLELDVRVDAFSVTRSAQTSRLMLSVSLAAYCMSLLLSLTSNQWVRILYMAVFPIHVRTYTHMHTYI